MHAAYMTVINIVPPLTLTLTLYTLILQFFVLTSAAPPLLTPLYYCLLCVALCCLLGTNYNGQWSIDTWATVFEFQLAPGT